MNKISDNINKEFLINSINELKKNPNNIILNSAHYLVFFAKLLDYNPIMIEIAMQRENSFRNVGEGSLNAIDIDEYDAYYYQLFIWDDVANNIVGGYRLGFGKEIFRDKGVRGFYSHKLYKISTELESLFCDSIELGRAFISLLYQKKTLPLFLLWEAISKIANSIKPHAYFLGSVSISNSFTIKSKKLIIRFLKENYFDFELAQYIKPRQELNLFNDDEMDYINYNLLTVQDLDLLIFKYEHQKRRMPILLKKYLNLPMKVIAFNLDLSFNHSIDAFIYVSISNIIKNQRYDRLRIIKNNS